MSLLWRRKQMAAVTAFLLGIALLFPQTGNSTKPEDSDFAATLDTLLSNKEYPELIRQFARSKLSQVDSDYFNGVIAAIQNRIAESTALLQKSIPRLKNRKHIEVAMLALADDYERDSRFIDAAKMYSDVLDHFQDQIEPARKKGIENDFHMVELLKNAPPQTVNIFGESAIAIRRSRFGWIDVPVLIGGRTEWWMLDTGASYTTITMSTAKRLGLDISKGNSRTQGATGVDLDLRVAVVPQLTLGKAQLQNVTAVVLDDSSLAIDTGQKETYQIEGIIGTALLRALDSITFYGDEKMVIHGSDLPSAISFPMYLDSNQPLIAIQIAGRDLTFSLDTGANGSQFTEKYCLAFEDVLAGGQKYPFSFSGAGGVKAMQVYRQKVELHGDGGAISLGSIAIMTEPAGIPAIDDYYGNIGQDILQKVRNFTLDFHHMRFRTSQPPPKANQN